MTRDTSVFDDIERQAQVFSAIRYLERTAADRKRRRAAVTAAFAAGVGLVGTVTVHARLLLARGEYSTGGAVAVAALGTLPLLAGLGAYIAGLEYLRVLDRDIERTDPAPMEPLLGVVAPEPLTWSSSETGSTRL